MGGELSSRKGINLPDSNIQAPALTPKDEGDLVVGLAAGVDFVALSFVRHGDDVRLLRKRLEENGQGDIPIISKIEKPQAVENIDDILEESDGIMVARGDLGVEIPISTVPVVQKELIKAAQKKGRLVITATQMLESMTHHPFPTRAEVTDVANAILDGSDAVMLSGETSVGLYPFRCIKMMSNIAYEIESSSHMQSTQITEMDKLKGKLQHCRSSCLLCCSKRVTVQWLSSHGLGMQRWLPLVLVHPNQSLLSRPLEWSLTNCDWCGEYMLSLYPIWTLPKN